jgi:hypothetical protein
MKPLCQKLWWVGQYVTEVSKTTDFTGVSKTTF